MRDLERSSFRSMGTDVALIAPAGSTHFETASAVVRAVFDREDRRFSRFRADSELSHVNARAGEWTSVSMEFAAVVNLAIVAWRETFGRFDPTVLDAVIAAGYDRDFDELLAGARGALRPARPCGRAGEVEVDVDRLRIPDGVGLDLGGIAKGWTVDVAAEAAVASGLPWALVNAGGDLRIAGWAPPGGIDVGLEDPEVADALAGRLFLDEGSIATSSVTRRAWGGGLHHLIDPLTALPVNGPVLQATVWAPTCAEAEVRAKEALLEGAPYLDHGTALLWLQDGRILTNLAASEEVPA
jgi:thiamine biosynthesis lipoprotein